ncbi:protein of unknown function [Lactiplantibacillus plantarum]
MHNCLPICGYRFFEQPVRQRKTAGQGVTAVDEKLLLTVCLSVSQGRIKGRSLLLD